MPDKNKLQELIAATQQHINLREAVIEKDYYVTQVTKRRAPYSILQMTLHG
ncbi:MAG: hypothetical protein QNK11_06845 [Legionella sp.]|nr:hypothetical protein [Legionella sp.]